jgi:hypothetical protein
VKLLVLFMGLEQPVYGKSVAQKIHMSLVDSPLEVACISSITACKMQSFLTVVVVQRSLSKLFVIYLTVAASVLDYARDSRLRTRDLVGFTDELLQNTMLSAKS